MAADVDYKLYSMRSLVTIDEPGGTYHDVPVVWGVCERAELPAPAEVLFNDPERAKNIDIHQVPWPDVWYRLVIERALQLFSEDEADAFRVWLARQWDTECTVEVLSEVVFC